MGRRLLLLLAVVASSLVPAGKAGAYSNYGYKWKELGPAPVCCMFPSPTTGRATSIAVNPFNKDDVWLGTAGGGVWHSTDAGQSWKPMSDDQEALAIGAIAVSGCNATFCSTIYAGTGENASRRDTYHGVGLLVGTFDGTTITWIKRSGTPYNFKYGSIYNIVLGTVAPSGQNIYVTLSSGVTASASESTVTAPEPAPGGYGIFRSTDNGATWSKVLDAGKPTDLEIDRTSNQTLYAGILGKGIFKTTNGGASWCPLNPGNAQPPGCNFSMTGLPNGTAPPPPNNPNAFVYDHVEIATDPNLPQPQSHLFATFGRCSDPLVDECEPALYESVNGGATWMQRYVGSDGPWVDPYPFDNVVIPPCPYAYTRYTHPLTVDPADSTSVLLGGLRLCRWKPATGWASSDVDQGVSPYGSITHLDHHAIVHAPSDPLRVYDAHDGGVSVSSTGGLWWQGANGAAAAGGLGIIGFQSIASSPFTPNVIGGAQDNAGMKWSGAMLWDHLPCCGDGGFSVMEHDTANGMSDDMYVTSNVGGIIPIVDLPIRSLNGGTDFQKPPWDNGYDTGIPNDHQRAFYSPLLEHATTFDLYFGTHTLFKSTNASTSYAAISPKLSANTVQGIVGGKDVITAIGVSPSNPSQVYLGYFSGRTFHSAGPCGTAACWPEGTALPGPVTWIAVHPTLDQTAYATVSGFQAGGHVYKTTDGGVTWVVLASTPGMSGVPANTIFIEPAVPQRLWVGNDNGIYLSGNGGGSWSKYSKGLPNVPVYGFTRNKDKSLMAATHGRGAWALMIYNLAPTGTTPVGNITYNAAALGQGFMADQSCTLAVIRRDGSVCAAGPNDALGGAVGTDARGFLVSSRPDLPPSPVVRACAEGKCLDRDVMDCNVPGNAMAFVQVACGRQVARAAIEPEPPAQDPPGTVLGLGFLAPGGAAPATVSGSFTLVPAVQSGDGSTRRLCSSVIGVSPTDTAGGILQRAVAAINADPACRLAGVSAAFRSGSPEPGGEDRFPSEDRLVLEAPLLNGNRLVPAVQTGAGATTGLCFRMGGLRHVAETAGLRIRFTTPTTGAHGGPLHLVERSPLGRCEIVATIPPGAQGTGVAQAVAAAFQAPAAGDPNPGCPARVNPRDVTRQGSSVRAAFASEMEVCLDDAAVGVSVAPEEICFATADCDDGNACTIDACDPITGQCTHAAGPDGTACADADPCTTGLTCSSGVCGTRPACNDGNRCTADACDPATGACVSTPVVCDDGNECTHDACDAGTGECVFAPLPAGTSCDDGDPCSTGDACVLEAGQPSPACSGVSACDDSDPCTSDQCDTDNGACVFLPIQCDDGNPCTVDQCEAGVCRSSGVTGVACDDGNNCTSGDTCAFHPANGEFSCDGSAVSCDDRNPCTVDACDPVTGGCVHAPASLAPVPLLNLTDATHVGWSSSPGALTWNSYRGTIPAHMLGSRPPPRYDQTCFEAHDSAGDGAQVSFDSQIPPPGTAFYYLSSAADGCGESVIGNDSNTTPIPNNSPCPP